MRTEAKRYVMELTAACVAYAGLVLLSSVLLDGAAYGAGGRTLVALLPVPGCVAMAWAVLRQLRRLDELARRMQLEALGFAFVVTILLSAAYGFLETAGWPRLSMFAVEGLLGFTWMAGGVLAWRRYQP